MNRRTSLRRRSLTRRRPKRLSCLIRGCKRRPGVLGWCLTHAHAKADRVLAAYVKARDQGCAAEGPHGGSLQWAHIISRRYRAVRWNSDNGVTLCARHHTYFTHRPLEWAAWVEARIGAEAFAALRRDALNGSRPDIAAVIKVFGGRAA